MHRTLLADEVKFSGVVARIGCERRGSVPASTVAPIGDTARHTHEASTLIYYTS